MSVSESSESVDSKKSEPRWVYVASVLRDRIAKGLSQDGRGLSDIALANEFKVSTAVVRQAVGQLVEEGLLTRQRGKGTFLNREPLQGNLKLESFRAWYLQGRSVHVEILDLRTVAANIAVAAGMGVQVGEPVTYLKRLRSADGLPVALDHRYIPSDLVEGVDAQAFGQEAIWRVLEGNKKVDIKESVFTIKAALATSETAEVLDVPVGSPVLEHQVQVVDAAGRGVVLGTTYYHPDRFVYRAVTKYE